jgi:uncharacterized LabA/DUF88 family protein
MLRHAFMDNYDVAVLASGDGDYVPLTDAVKSHGKRVEVVAFGTGLSPEIPRVPDQYLDPTEHFIGRWRAAIDHYPETLVAADAPGSTGR